MTDHYGKMILALRGLVVLVLILVALSILTGCGTVRESSYVERHRMESLMERMDSLIATRTVVQQDSAWRELIMRQFESIREKTDTSRTFVVDTAGRVIKETLIINNVRETTSETDRQEILMMSRRLEVIDSTMSLIRQRQETSDSLLQAMQETKIKEVPAKLSAWQRFRMGAGDCSLVLLAVAAGVWLIRKKTWWLTILKKII